MDINIVTVQSGWILQKIAERTAANNKDPSVNMTVSHTANPNTVNYYADLQNCYYGNKTKLDVAYFTHADRNSKQWLVNLLRERGGYQLNGIVSMNKRYTDMLVEVGYPANRVTTIVPGETNSTFPIKKIKIGIVSRGGYEGYGEFFIQNLVRSYNFENIQLLFLGNGWDAVKQIANQRNLDFVFLPDADYSIYPAFYQSLDYLLVPGLWTAGPMSIQEALSTGIPIISADVGFANYEFKVDHIFQPNNIQQLISILDNIKVPFKTRRKQVEGMTWQNYAKSVVDFIKYIGGLP